MGDEWKNNLLTDIYSVSSGLSKPAADFGSGFPFVTFKDVFQNFFLPEKLGGLVQSSEQERAKCSVLRGDVFLTRTSETMDELGMSCVALQDYDDATFNGFTKRLRPRQTNVILPEYAGYYLRSQKFRQTMLMFSTMSTRASLNNEMIGRLRIVFPSLDSQRSIARMLKVLDDKIELNRQTNQTLEAMAQALFKSWFVDFDPVIDNALATGNDIPEPFKARAAKRQALGDKRKPLTEEIRREFPDGFEFVDEMGWVPRGWDVLKVKDLCDRVQNGGTPSKGTALNWDDGDIPWLTSGEVRQNVVIGTERYITELGLASSSAKWLPTGSTLVAMYGATAGQVAYSANPLTTNQAICGLVPKNGHTFFNYIFLIGNIRRLASMARGSAQQNISKGIIESVKVIAPRESLLLKFDEICKSIFDRYVVGLKSNAELAELRDTLLPKLLSGDLTIPDAEKHAADVL